ncbi:MAG: hypothetical protein ACRYGA_02175 [Janthinobacterium lividum]
MKVQSCTRLLFCTVFSSLKPWENSLLMKSLWTHIMRNKSALIAGVLAGIASPATIGAPVKYPRPQGSDLNRMRADVQRLGGDFKTVIERENGNQKPASEAGTAAKS